MNLRSCLPVPIPSKEQFMLLRNKFGSTGYPGDTAGSLPDHRNTVAIPIKRVAHIFWFPSVYKRYVDTVP